MPQRTFLYHSSNPRGQIFDLDEPGLAQTLAAEGWVDTPDKLRPEHRLNSTDEVAQPVPRETPVVVTAASGAALTGAVLAAFSILASTEAKDRIAILFDTDGTPRHAGLALEYLAKVIDAMSLEELVFVGEVLGLKALPPDAYTSRLRADIAGALRPDEMAPAAAVVEAMDKTADEDEVTAAEGERPEVEVLPGVPIPARGGELSADELGKLDEQGREAWLTHDDTTKEHLRAVLIAKGKTFKARDGKEELQEAIRLTYSE